MYLSLYFIEIKEPNAFFCIQVELIRRIWKIDSLISAQIYFPKWKYDFPYYMFRLICAQQFFLNRYFQPAFRYVYDGLN